MALLILSNRNRCWYSVSITYSFLKIDPRTALLNLHTHWYTGCTPRISGAKQHIHVHHCKSKCQCFLSSIPPAQFHHGHHSVPSFQDLHMSSQLTFFLQKVDMQVSSTACMLNTDET